MKATKNIGYITTIALSVCISWAATGQLPPLPAKPQSGPILLIGGTIHTGAGEVVQDGILGFEDGKITLLGNKNSVVVDRGAYTILDVGGQHVYPGLILPNSLIGIEEISGVPHSNDRREQGDINPSLKTVFAFDSGSGHIPTLRFNGILMVESVPSRGLISGTSAVMEMDGWNWQESVYKAGAAIHLHWPASIATSYDRASKSTSIKANEKYEQRVSDLDGLFEAAMVYGNIAGEQANLKLQSMKGLFTGEKSLFIHAAEPREIVESIQFAQEKGVKKMAVITAYSALLVKDFLKNNEVPVILPPTYKTPEREDMDYDTYYKLPYVLNKEGILTALSHTGMLSTSRNLPFYAGVAASFGLGKEDALKLVSLNPAKILGIDETTGSLEVGKDATLFVSEGDALDIKTNSLTYAFIRGKKIVLEGPHQQIFKRYSQKYGHGQ